MAELYLELIQEQQEDPLLFKKIVRKYIMLLLTFMHVVLELQLILSLLIYSCLLIYNFKDLTVVGKVELVAMSLLLLNFYTNTMETLEHI